MVRARLYVRSRRVTIPTGHVSMESIGAVHTTTEYTEGSTLSRLSREDAYARDLLKRYGIDHDLIDLSGGVGTRLRARLKGVIRTPTLFDEDDGARVYEGVDQISQYVRSHKVSKQARP